MPTLSSTGNPLPGVKMTPQSGMGCCFFLTSVQCRGPIPCSVLQNMNTTSGKSTPLLEGVPGTGNCCYLQSFPDPHLHSFATQEEDWCLSVLSPPPFLTPQHQGSAQSTSATWVSSSLPSGSDPWATQHCCPTDCMLPRRPFQCSRISVLQKQRLSRKQENTGSASN